MYDLEAIYGIYECERMVFVTILIKKNFYEKSVRDLEKFIQESDEKIENTKSNVSVEKRKEVRDAFIMSPLLYMD